MAQPRSNGFNKRCSERIRLVLRDYHHYFLTCDGPLLRLRKVTR